MEIKQFNRSNLKKLEEAVIKAVQPVAEEFGIQIKYGGGSFTATDFKLRLVCAVQNDDGTYETPERADFKKFAYMYGLTADDIDMEFTWNGEKHKLSGLKTRGKKFPFIGKRVKDGKQFKFGADIVKFAKAQQNGSD